MSIISQIGPLQWQVPIVDEGGRPAPEFIRYFTQLFANTTVLSGSKQDASDNLTGISALTGTGLMSKTGPSSFTTRTLIAGSGVTVTNGDGIAGNPTIALSGGTTLVHSIPILAGAMLARTTNGATSTTTESATNKVMRYTLEFDQTTNQYAQMLIPMPKSWNEGTVTIQFLWTSIAGTGDVVWGVQAVAISDGDPLDAIFGTAQTVTDTLIAVGDQHETAFTSALTVSGTPVDNDLVCFQFYRDAANAADTLSSTASLIGVRINITTNLADDS